MRTLSIALVLIAACTSTSLAPSPSAQTPRPTAAIRSGTPAPALRIVPLGNGLVLDVPATWTLAPAGIVNMATHRYVFAGNGDLTSLPTIPGNGDVNTATMPADRVVLEIESQCRLACAGPQAETSLPLDWNDATPRPMPGLPNDRHDVALGFRWFDQPLFIVAKWTDAAPTADVAAIARIVASVRADPSPPTSGEFQGWDGLGPLASIPVGAVRLQQLPAGATLRSQGRIHDNAPFFLVRGKENVYAFSSRPLVDQRCVIAYDANLDRFLCEVGGRAYQWTRFGHYLGPEPASELPQHRVIVREGSVWVRYIETSMLIPSVRDEGTER